MDNNRIKWWWVSLLVLVAVGAIIYLLRPYFAGEKAILALWLDWRGIELHWYGVFMALGVLIGWWWLDKSSKNKLWYNYLVELVTIAVLGGIIGARLLFVLLKLSEFVGQWQNIFNITNGGLSIHGALIGGSIALWWFCRKKHLPIWEILDRMTMSVVLGQILGRWGNFFNQEAFGGPTSSPWKMYIDIAHRPRGLESYSFFHPTFLYEIVGLIVLLAVLWFFYQKQTKTGTRLLIYLLGYSLLRFGIEFYRIDSDYWSYLTVAQWGSLAIMAVAIIGLILKYRNDHRINHN